jgi:NitT/TauT family transport system ATP-binding protein
MISFNHVRRVFGKNCVILDDVHFNVEEKSFVTLFGPNGCGKTTLMNMLCGTDHLTAGRIDGAEALQGQIGFVFQDYRRTLLPWRSGADNILLPLQLRGFSADAQRQRLDDLVRRLQPDFDLKQKIYTLSGGQAQMVSLMRALIIQPRLLILDEPFSALDYARTLSFRQLVMDIARDFGLTVLFISHDLEEALYLGDKVVFLTQKPTRVAEILPVPIPRPRQLTLFGSSDFAALKLRALEIFGRCAGDVLPLR